MKVERKEDPLASEIVFTIILTNQELEQAGNEMTPEERPAAYLMSQSPMLSTQLCALVELLSALEKAEAKAALDRMKEGDYEA